MQNLHIIVLIIFLCSCSGKEDSVMDSPHGKQNVDSATTGVSSRDSPAPQNPWPNISTSASDAAKVSDEAKKALIGIYGNSIFIDKRLVKFLKVDTGYVTPVFEQTFTEGGNKKLLVVGVISDAEKPMPACHACVPVIGGAIFIKLRDRWVVESEQKVIGWGGPFASEGQISLVHIGKDKYGVSIRNSDMHQGFEYSGVRILVPRNGNLDLALDVSFTDKPSEGACEFSNKLPQSLDVKFEPANRNGYFDAVIRMQYNDGDCNKSVRYDKTTRYILRDGKYDPV